MIRQVLHHAQALPQILLHLQVHQDGADEPDAEDGNADWQNNAEILMLIHHDDGDDEEGDLEAGDEESVRESLVDLLAV